MTNLIRVKKKNKLTLEIKNENEKNKITTIIECKIFEQNFKHHTKNRMTTIKLK